MARATWAGSGSPSVTLSPRCSSPPGRAGHRQSVTALGTGSGSVQVSFTPVTPSALVDIHYLPNGGGEQDFRMANNAGAWQQTINGLNPGSTLEYWFTYEKSGPLYVTPHFTWAVGGSGGGTGGAGGTGGTGGGTGSFPIVFQNNTHGAYSNAQVYVTVLGQVVPGQWSYMKPDGSMVHIPHPRHRLVSAPDQGPRTGRRV